jgi:cellulose biosynthesis protein BcsQ
VLLIDLDPQGNATTGCGVVKREAMATVYQILIGRSTISASRLKTEFGFDILPANRELAGAEIDLIDMASVSIGCATRSPDALRLRFHPHGLSAGVEPADGQRAGRRR